MPQQYIRILFGSRDVKGSWRRVKLLKTVKVITQSSNNRKAVVKRYLVSSLSLCESNLTTSAISIIRGVVQLKKQVVGIAVIISAAKLERSRFRKIWLHLIRCCLSLVFCLLSTNN